MLKVYKMQKQLSQYTKIGRGVTNIFGYLGTIQRVLQIALPKSSSNSVGLFRAISKNSVKENSLLKIPRSAGICSVIQLSSLIRMPQSQGPLNPLYSPLTVTTTDRFLSRTSNSIWTTCCQVPSTSFPARTGMIMSGPRMLACR